MGHRKKQKQKLTTISKSKHEANKNKTEGPILYLMLLAT